MERASERVLEKRRNYWKFLRVICQVFFEGMHARCLRDSRCRTLNVPRASWFFFFFFVRARGESATNEIELRDFCKGRVEKVNVHRTIIYVLARRFATFFVRYWKYRQSNYCEKDLFK